MPAEHIIRHFSNLPLPLVLLGGSTETESAQIIKAAMGDRCINLVAQCDLHTTGKILDDAEWVISHDTATMHMAAAFRKKIGRASCRERVWSEEADEQRRQRPAQQARGRAGIRTRAAGQAASGHHDPGSR